ncbi:MAG: transglutaminase-like domain-containing protein [Elusimicrobia bacterium]|nr:transglutaminase-like domain-containing protein [Elusimicrobiota bacterium]MDD7501664.1 transglutaminase family protein [Elusimicrobiota bacterium]MDY5729773.1 transglutaminase family protein [Elusimicrobiaceae bacterium]
MQTLGYDGIKALIKLLETEADAYGPVLKRALTAAIKTNPAQVQQVMEEQFQTSAPRTVISTLEEICWEDLSAALSRFAAKINPDLEEGLSLLSKFTSPASVRGDISAPLDAMAAELRPVLLNAKNYSEIAALLGRYIFQVKGFTPLQTRLDVKDISFARFLRKKRGSSLCAACLYMCLGQRYGMDINLIDLAGRILVHMRDFARCENLFIDPLDNGKALSLADCQSYIRARQINWTEDFLTPLSSRQIIRRAVANMIFISNKLRDERRLAYLRNYLQIIRG